MKRLVRSFLLLLALFAGGAGAAPSAFEPARFDALQKEGKPILVHIHADWCPTCRAQAPIVAELARAPEFKSVEFLRVDFDAQKAAVKSLRATMQSTLIVFKGGQELGRSTGDTDRASIVALLKKAL